MRRILRVVLFGLMVSMGFSLYGLCGGMPAFARALEYSSASAEEQQLMEAYESGSLIRLHILAEDDTREAQTVKLAVRDAVLEAFALDLCVKNPQQLYLALKARADDMRAVAETTAQQMGFNGPVTTEVGVFTLPEKQYGNVVLPRGEYRSLRITLGKGDGQNWWCVLYPSLCLAVADDEPWRTPSPDQTDAPKGSIPIVIWDTERLMSQWLLWPGVP